MKKIGFGIIGLGRQGLRLAEHVRKDIKHGNLVAVCRRSGTGHDYSKRYGVRFYSDYHDLLKDKDVDAVIITTPSNLHGTQALDALKSGKHVLIDKPISSTLKDGEKILAQAKKKELIVGINFPLRVNPVSTVLRSNIKKIGRLKKVQLFVSHGPIRTDWQNDLSLSNGGVILDLGSHYFDLLFFITGCQPETVHNAHCEKTENEDSGFVDLVYKNFCVSMILLRNQKLKKSILTIAGDRGTIEADYVGRKVVISNNHELDEIECPMSHDFEMILNNMVKAINKKDDIIANGEAGLNSLKTALSVYNTIKIPKMSN